MVTVKVRVDRSKLLNVEEKFPQIKEKGLSLVSQELINRLQKNSPVDHGLLKGWYVFEYTPGEQVKIKSPAHYVKYVNDGTGIYGPHKTPIYSKHIGKPMAFQVGGQMIYTRMIRGQKPQKIVERSIAEVEGKLGNLFIKAVREVLN